MLQPEPRLLSAGLRPHEPTLSREAVPADNPRVRDQPSDLLGQLEDEARALSLRRRTLHERIDYLRGDADSADQIAYLEAQAREVSAQRLELHARIDALRAGRAVAG